MVSSISGSSSIPPDGSTYPQLHLVGEEVPKGHGIVLGAKLVEANASGKQYINTIPREIVFNSIALWDVVVAPIVRFQLMEIRNIGVFLNEEQVELSKRGLIHPIIFQYFGSVKGLHRFGEKTNLTNEDVDVFAFSREAAVEYLGERDQRPWGLAGENDHLINTLKVDDAAVLSLACKFPIIKHIESIDSFEKFLNDRKSERQEVSDLFRRLSMSARQEGVDLDQVSKDLKNAVDRLSRVLEESKAHFQFGVFDLEILPLKGAWKRFMGINGTIETLEDLSGYDLEGLGVVKALASAIGTFAKIHVSNALIRNDPGNRPYHALIKLREDAKALEG